MYVQLARAIRSMQRHGQVNALTAHKLQALYMGKLGALEDALNHELKAEEKRVKVASRDELIEGQLYIARKK